MKGIRERFGAELNIGPKRRDRGVSDEILHAREFSNRVGHLLEEIGKDSINCRSDPDFRGSSLKKELEFDAVESVEFQGGMGRMMDVTVHGERGGIPVRISLKAEVIGRHVDELEKLLNRAFEGNETEPGKLGSDS